MAAVSRQLVIRKGRCGFVILYVKFTFCMFRLFPALLLQVLFASPLLAVADKEAVKYFEQHVRPLLVEHCYSCHSAEAKKLKGNLLLDSKEGWERGGDSGQPSIIPGDVEQSLLFRSLLHHQDDDLHMPPKKKLAERDIAVFAEWIKMGAPDPRTDVVAEVKRADKTWWSLQPLKTSRPVRETKGEEVIDHYIMQGLDRAGLEMNPPASARDLLRRMTYDLTGLPPSYEEVQAFEKAYESEAVKAVDDLIERLLASPHYGERWGRHWLDVVRFGESRGYERNLINDQLWLFRDYVIRSFNEDKPFNQLILEHLAGDVVGKNNPEVEIGTAFLTCGTFDDVGNQDAMAKAVIRADTVDDMITATGSAFLGLTLNCARCHHHKFDPIPTEDYYRVKSALDGVQHASRIMATEENRRGHAEQVAPLDKEIKRLKAEKEALEKQAMDTHDVNVEPRPVPSAQYTEEVFSPVKARFLRFNMLATSMSATSGVNGRIDEFEVWSTASDKMNVALAANGGKATGNVGRVAEDFAGAYGVQRVNDGKFSERWIVGSPALLTLEFARVEEIDRISFSHDRMAKRDVPVPGLGPSVVEYEVEVSVDGSNWTKVADSFDRKPASDALAKARQLRAIQDESVKAELGSLEKKIAELQNQRKKVPALPVAWAGKFEQPKQPTTVFRGGDAMKPGDVVKPASLAVLDLVTPSYELAENAPEHERRLQLARWIASDDNPLTARVIANRIWHYHFGIGLVDTPGDFGFLGSQPSHPELLDWLALRLQHHGWSIKKLHRDILRSKTYQQAATWRREAASKDKDARLLWRFPPRRLGAEEIRDSLLVAAGQMEARMGGPGFRLYAYKNDNVSTYVPLEQWGRETYRRAVYHQNARASVVDILTDFDLPDTAFATPKRAATTTPLQALTLLNHSFVVDMADAMASRTKDTAGGDVEQQLTQAFRLCFQRDPSGAELSAARGVYHEHGLSAVCRALLNSNEFLYLD